MTIELKNITKIYSPGRVNVKALENVNLNIDKGEFIAIVGASGSGKSTLLHIIGLIDRPTSGTYKIMGFDCSRLNDRTAAFLRSKLIGFVFQQFHLISSRTVLQNVLLPSIYFKSTTDIRKRAIELLNLVGLGDKLNHKANELSGGEQQRVAIARALINNPVLILADEPTGNLDSKTGKEILQMLKKLHEEGKTLIVVTHDENVGAAAQRIIRIKDGHIVEDTKRKTTPSCISTSYYKNSGSKKINMLAIFSEAFRSMLTHPVRVLLSILGILIGVGAVVTMMAVGSGAKKAIEQRLSDLGSKLLIVNPGTRRIEGVALEAGAVTRFRLEDLNILKNLDCIKYISASVMGRVQVVYEDKNWNTTLDGESSTYTFIRNQIPQAGRFFTDEEVRSRAKVAVLGTKVVKELFGDKNPIGETIKINRIHFTVIGVMPPRGMVGFRDADDTIYVPVTTAMYRLLGQQYVARFQVEVKPDIPMQKAADEIKRELCKIHHIPINKMNEAIEIRDMTEIQETLSSTTQTMSMLLGSIATIALLVGGIGIMNVMLISVTERTKEIGLRKAIGGSFLDILTQFLIEAIILCVVGGITGIGAGIISAFILGKTADWPVLIPLESIALALTFSAAIGLIFGIWPAWKAARLDAVEALRYE